MVPSVVRPQYVLWLLKGEALEGGTQAHKHSIAHRGKEQNPSQHDEVTGAQGLKPDRQSKQEKQ